MRPPADSAPKHKTLTRLAAVPSAAAVSYFSNAGGDSNRSRSSSSGSSVAGNDAADEAKQFDVRRRCAVNEGEASDLVWRHPSRQSMTSQGENEHHRDRSLSDETIAPSETIVSGDQSRRRAVDGELASRKTITDVSGTASVEVVDGRRGCELSQSRVVGGSSEVPSGDSTRGGHGEPDYDWEVRYFSLVMQGAAGAGAGSAGGGGRKAQSVDRVPPNRCDGGGVVAVNGCNCKRVGVEVSSRPRLNFRKMQVGLRRVLGVFIASRFLSVLLAATGW